MKSKQKVSFCTHFLVTLCPPHLPCRGLRITTLPVSLPPINKPLLYSILGVWNSCMSTHEYTLILPMFWSLNPCSLFPEMFFFSPCDHLRGIKFKQLDRKSLPCSRLLPFSPLPVTEAPPDSSPHWWWCARHIDRVIGQPPA